MHAQRIVVGLFAGTLAAWAVAIMRLRGMDEGPGTDLGALTSFLGIWVTMMAAMMLPSVAPMVLTFARVHAQRSVRGRPDAVPTWVFVSGYFAVWTAYGLVPYGLFLVARDRGASFLDWEAPAVTSRAAPSPQLVCTSSHSPSTSAYATADRLCTSSPTAGGKGGSERSAWASSTAPTASGVASGCS